jgi:hypothetical protein
MRPPSSVARFVPALVLALAAAASGQVLVLDDPLQGSTKGTRSGGTLTAAGWQVTGQYDSIYWHVPTISKGAVEWSVRGLRPNESRAGMEDKSEIFHMYDWKFGDSDNNYNGGYRDNPYKHFIRKIGSIGGTVDAMELVWKIGEEYVEPDTAVLSWSEGTTYRFREEWGTEGGNGAIRTYRDGVLLKTMSLPGPYAPPGHSIRIAASTRRAADAGAPVGAVYSGVKVWDLSATVPAAPRVTAPAAGGTVPRTVALIRWEGGIHDRYRVRIAASNGSDSDVEWDSGDVASSRDFAWTGALADKADHYVFVRLGSSAGWGPWSAGGRRFRVDTATSPPPGGAVSVEGSSLVDSGGPFLALGATYMQALRRCKYDRPRLESDLDFLAGKGFNYVRVLSMVGWYPAWEGLEIAPVSFTSQAGKSVAAWPDYWQQVRELIDLVALRGMRTQVTIFADAQLMPAKAARIAHMATLLSNLAGREGKVILLEVANEAWQNGFPDAQGIADLREFGQYLADRTAIPVALSATCGTTADLLALYSGSAADIATEHFSRDIGTAEGGWLPVRDCWRVGLASGLPPASSNEPIGPGSSVNNEKDPVRLVSAAAFAFIANLPMYVFHSSAGVFGAQAFQDMQGAGAYAHLREILPPDLAGWVRNDGIEESAPFTVYCQGRANAYWTEVAGATSGCHRSCGATKGSEFVAFPMGILAGGVELEARRPVTFEVIDPIDGTVVQSLARDAGGRFTLARGRGAYILKGSVHESLPAKKLRAKATVPLRIDGDPGDWRLEEFEEPLPGGGSGEGDYAVIGFHEGSLCYAGFYTDAVLPTGPADHTARVYARHDAERLYFLVRCDDSDIRSSYGADQNWANDCAEFYIDPARDGGGTALLDSTSDVQLVIDVLGQRNIYMCAAAYAEGALEGVEAAVDADGTGWWLEVGIRKDALHPVLPAQGSIGLDFNFRDNDADNDPAATTVYTWSDTASGAGFPSKVPDRWAEAVLEDLASVQGARRMPNDCNRDSLVDISDALCLLGHLFLGQALHLGCGEESASAPAVAVLLDATGDGAVDLSDPVLLLGHLFLGGRAPTNGGIRECLWFAGCDADACP